mmetsp:Transcript_15057/g.37496  ORF Transcript_15057/g.37496 Transcript_15057/m.37496 type:complete len:776 (+) Transcript_15057:297-2624(+)
MHRSSNQELMLRHNKPLQIDLELNSADAEGVIVPCIYLRNDITAEKKRAVLVGCIGWPRASVGRIAELAPLARGGFGTVHALRVFQTSSLPGPDRILADDDGSFSTFSTSMAKGPLTSLQHQRQSQDDLQEQVEDAEPRHALKLVRVDLSEKMTEHNEGLDADNFLRTYRELVFSTTLKHRNVMAVLGAWTFTDPFASHRWSLSMLMRFATCDFTKLGGKKLNRDYAKLEKYVAQLAAGFRYLERMGLIHRDVKRENLSVVPYVRENGGRGDRAVIGDLGMMQAASQVPSLAGGGSGTRGFGTTEYLPPETLKPVVAEALRAPQFDWWAFGAVIYELLHADVTEDNSWWQVMQPEGSDEPPFKVMELLAEGADLKKAHPNSHHQKAFDFLLRCNVDGLRAEGLSDVSSAPSASSSSTPSVTEASGGRVARLFALAGGLCRINHLDRELPPNKEDAVLADGVQLRFADTSCELLDNVRGEKGRRNLIMNMIEAHLNSPAMRELHARSPLFFGESAAFARTHSYEQAGEERTPVKMRVGAEDHGEMVRKSNGLGVVEAPRGFIVQSAAGGGGGGQQEGLFTEDEQVMLAGPGEHAVAEHNAAGEGGGKETLGELALAAGNPTGARKVSSRMRQGGSTTGRLDHGSTTTGVRERTPRRRDDFLYLLAGDHDADGDAPQTVLMRELLVKYSIEAADGTSSCKAAIRLKNARSSTRNEGEVERHRHNHAVWKRWCQDNEDFTKTACRNTKLQQADVPACQVLYPRVRKAHTLAGVGAPSK